MKPRISIETKRAIFDAKYTMMTKVAAKHFGVSEGVICEIWNDSFFKTDTGPSWPEPKRKVEKTAHGIFNVTLRENWLV